MDDSDDKIVSLAERRRAAAAQQKAEIARTAQPRRKTNGATRPVVQPRAPASERSPVRGPPAQRVGRWVGRAAAVLVWSLLIGTVALLILQRLA